MEALWNACPATGSEVARRLEGSGWHIKTVRTFLRRLIDKGVVEKDASVHPHTFAPKVGREDCIRAAGDSFLQRFFRGDVGALLLHFVDQPDIDDETLARLRARLDPEVEEKR